MAVLQYHQPSASAAIPPYRVLLVDDSPIFIRVATEFINRQPGVEVKGFALSGETAFQQARKLHPEVIIIDLDMQVFSNPHAIAYLRAKAPQAIIIALTLAQGFDPRLVSQVLGIDLIVSKAELSTALPEIIHTAIQLLEDSPEIIPAQLEENSLFSNLVVA
jgi:DNA-binding NarL/FixJ family response regulator